LSKAANSQPQLLGGRREWALAGTAAEVMPALVAQLKAPE